MSYIQYRGIGNRIHASKFLPDIVCAHYTILGTDLTTTYKKFVQHKQYATLQEKQTKL